MGDEVVIPEVDLSLAQNSLPTLMNVIEGNDPLCAVLCPEASWDDIFAISNIIFGRTPEQNGYCRIMCLVPPPFGEFVIECGKQTEFIVGYTSEDEPIYLGGFA